MAVITDVALSAYLDDDTILESGRAKMIVELTDELVTDEWADPVEPVPARVKLLALEVASRAWSMVPGRGPLESETRSFDDATRTERYAVTALNESGHQVYLTEQELALLHGKVRKRVGSISLGVPATHLFERSL
jgi:hypothetical protein